LLDQRISQNELCCGHRIERDRNNGLIPFVNLVTLEPDAVFLNGYDGSAKTLPSGDRDSRLNAGNLPDRVDEIFAPYQWTVNARRGNFKLIGTVDRIIDVKRRRNGETDLLAIIDGHRAIRPLGHDLQRDAILIQQLDADQPVADGVNHGGDDSRHSGFSTRFA